MEYRLTSYSIYEAGDRKDADGFPHQEDSIYPRHGRCGEEDRLFVVCDGMGGHDDGEVASAVVAEALTDSIFKRMRHNGGVFDTHVLQSAIDDTYSALDMSDTHAPRKMGTTMAMLMLYDRGYMTAHIGDSRVYHIRPGEDADSTLILFCTRDHALADTDAESRRHVITRAMQPNTQAPARPDVHVSADVRPGDYFMVCSHGMLENLTDEMIRYIFSAQGGNDRNKYNMLQRVTGHNSDNHSALVVHIEDVDNNESGRRRAQDSKTMQTSRNTNNRTGAGTRRRVSTPKWTPSLGADAPRLIIKLLASLMLLLTLIMVIYYAFIRHDENPPEAGRATDTEIIEQEYAAEEANDKYGYETDANTRTDDENVGEGKDQTVTEVTDGGEDGAALDAPITPEDEQPEPKAEEPEPKPAPDPMPEISE